MGNKVRTKNVRIYGGTRCMQYAVFVYVSSAQAVIQDLFLFLFKTKDRERSEIIDRAKRRRTKQAARETSTLLWGKEKSTNKDLSDREDLIYTYTHVGCYI